MKLRISPDSILERVALKFNLAPTPLIDTQIYFIVARAIMTAAELNIFDSLGRDYKTYQEISERAGTNPMATKHLLDCLTGIGYLKWNNAHYALKPKYYKWLLSESHSNIVDKLRFQICEWIWMTNLEDYVRTGKALEIHSTMSQSEWKSYQDGMAVMSINPAEELARKIQLPTAASHMLDIGGSHGFYSIELCKKYPALSSIILELPAAIPSARAIASKHGYTQRVNYKAGDALVDSLGEQVYDLILLNNVAHHFTAEENEKLTQKAARALKPGGFFGIGEFISNTKPGEGGVVGSAAGLYFSMTSKSGAWSVEDINTWQLKAGLKIKKPITLRTLPGWQMLIAIK